jgi:hypothetical protein
LHKICGLDLEVTASDIVYAVSALLEISVPEQGSMVAESGFWKAYECINFRNLSTIRDGLQKSIELQKLTVKYASTLIMMKKVMSPGPFRYAILDHLPGNALASQPLALIKLAHLAVDAYQVSTKRPHKPFVLCSLINSRKTYIVIGIPSPQTLRDVYRK